MFLYIIHLYTNRLESAGEYGLGEFSQKNGSSVKKIGPQTLMLKIRLYCLLMVPNGIVTLSCIMWQLCQNDSLKQIFWGISSIYEVQWTELFYYNRNGIHCESVHLKRKWCLFFLFPIVVPEGYISCLLLKKKLFPLKSVKMILILELFHHLKYIYFYDV